MSFACASLRRDIPARLTRTTLTARKIISKYFALDFCFSNLCKFYGFCKFYILMPTIFRVVKQISVSDKAGMPIEGEICERSEKLG
ncbi:MAG: hypothetical protein IJM31_08805 [Campylobacter sp.]|nr:hypothetical protein [Campylobacter sp.]MBR0070927.1 hypothetical protein [Campylobacter sp.]